MAVLSTETFEGTTLNAQITTAQTLFSAVTTGVVSVAGITGTKAARMSLATGVTGGVTHTGFNQPDLVARWLLKITTLPAASCFHANMYGLPTLGCSMRITPAGKIELRTTNTTVATSVMSLAGNTNYALEWRANGATSTQTLRIFTDTSLTAAPVETLSGAMEPGVTFTDRVRIGKYSADTDFLVIIDEYQRADDWIAVPASDIWNMRLDGTPGEIISSGGGSSSLATVTPMWSEKIRDSFGTNCHYKFSNLSGNIHTQIDALDTWLINLNPGWIRDRIASSGAPHTNQWDHFPILQAADIGIHMSMSLGVDEWWTTSQADMNYYFAELEKLPTDKITMGGVNESNEGHRTDWHLTTRNINQMIWNTRAGTGNTQWKICGPALKDQMVDLSDDFITMGNTNIDQYTDYGDFHRYPNGKNAEDSEWGTNTPWTDGGRTNEFHMRDRIQWSNDAYGSTETFSTEGGYNTDLTNPEGGVHLPDEIHGYYMERHLLALIYMGVRRWFQYELMDDRRYTAPGVEIPTAQLNEIARGLVFVDINEVGSLSPTNWRPKPAYLRLQALMNLVKDNEDGAYQPWLDDLYNTQDIHLEVTCNDAAFRHLVLQKRNGTNILLYWLDTCLWDTNQEVYLNNTNIDRINIGRMPTGALPGGAAVTSLAGMIASRKHLNLYWCCDDANPNHLIWGFEITEAGGIVHKKTIELVGNGFTFGATDDDEWQDMAYDPTSGSMWVANSGGGAQSQFTAFKFVEPDVLGSDSVVDQVSCDRFRFGYASGTYECEAMMCDLDGRVYFIPKSGAGSLTDPAATPLFRAPASLAAWGASGTVNNLANVQDIGQASHIVTSADWAPDSSSFTSIRQANGVTNPNPVAAFKFNASSPWAMQEQYQVAVAREQVLTDPAFNRTVCFTADSSGVLTTCAAPGTQVWLTKFPDFTPAAMTVEVPSGSIVLEATGVVKSYILPPAEGASGGVGTTVIAAGGVAVGQTWAHMGPVTTEVGLEQSFAVNPADSYERFYVQLENTLNNEGLTFWKTQTDAGNITAYLRFSNATGQSGNSITLYDVNDVAVSVATGIPPLAKVRVEIHGLNNSGTTVWTVRLFYGTGKLHSTTATKTLSGVSGGTGRKNRWIMKSSTTASRGIYFDDWAASLEDWVGPISDPFGGTTNQWAFYEWNSTTQTETPLTATVWSGTTADPLEIGSTTIQGETTPADQFPGDPGPNKMYFGWVTPSSVPNFSAEVAHMQTIVPPGGSARARTPSFTREFSTIGTDMFGSDAVPLRCRSFMQMGTIPFITYQITTAQLSAFLSGTNDAWIAQLATNLIDCWNRYSGIAWINLANEPEFHLQGFFNQSANLSNLRLAHRKLRTDLRAAGATHFAMTTPTYLQDTWDRSAIWGANNKVDGTTNVDAQRWDGWWEYHPDWKGTRSSTWNRAAVEATPALAWAPDPADFYQGTEKVVDLVGLNAYCDHAMTGNGQYNPAAGVWTWSTLPTGPYSETVYEAHTYLQRGDTDISPHAISSHQTLDNLYGTGNYRIAIGEMGWPIYEQSGVGSTYDAATCNLWAGQHYQEMMTAGVAGVAIWRQVGTSTEAEIQTSGNAMGGRLSQKSTSTHNGETDDPRHIGTQGHDCRRKAMAKIMDLSSTLNARTVGPPP